MRLAQGRSAAPTAAASGRTLLCCRRAPYKCREGRCISSRQRQLVCWAAATESSAEWGRLDDFTVASARHSATALLDDTLAQASAELLQLCQQQLQLLTAALQLSLQVVMSTGVSVEVGADEEALRKQLLLDSGTLRSTVYCRAPASLQTGHLQLQLVAACGGGGVQQARQQEQQQRFLFLGQEGVAGTSLADQEQWIVDQPVIVLPDSGGLVLPLAHNGFLVGLLVVERCLEEQQQPQQASSALASESTADASSSGTASGMPPPPACLLFRAAELQLLKQVAGVLALACAMDLRAALERAGAAYRQRQASALVQAARKPLSVMRTLGTMLLPRLQPGEPDRDFAQGILEQGSRLQEVVTQLQAALHPTAAPAAPLLQAGGLAGLQKALPGSAPSPTGSSSLSLSGSSGSEVWQRQRTESVLPRPALPSSTIGSDYQWGLDLDASAPGPPASTVTVNPPVEEFGGYDTPDISTNRNNIITSGSDSSSLITSSSDSSSVPVYGSRASADLLNVLMPLLASASNFAAVSGVKFVLAEHADIVAAGSPESAGASAGGSPPAQQPLVLPAAEVAVGPGKLKRMLSQLIDGIIACAARGDLVHASVLPQDRQGRPGVAVALTCCYGLEHSGSAGAVPLPRLPAQPEFAFLHTSAREVGGYFEVQSDAAPDVAHLNNGGLTASLWLPTVTRDAGWG